MNWNSGSVDAVSKERIWREHVLTEKNTARIHEDFRCNPLKKEAPTAEPINKRPARFLDRSAVIMDMLSKRLSRVKKHEDKERQSHLVDNMVAIAGPQDSARTIMKELQASGMQGTDGPSVRMQFQMQTRGMQTRDRGYGESARGLQKPKNLPPLLNNGAAAAAAGASGNTNKNVSSTMGSSPRSPRSANHDDFDSLYASALLTPRDKYAVPMTAMQELGWWNKPLVTQKELEPRFRYGLSQCEITRNGSAFVGSRKSGK